MKKSINNEKRKKKRKIEEERRHECNKKSVCAAQSEVKKRQIKSKKKIPKATGSKSQESSIRNWCVMLVCPLMNWSTRLIYFAGRIIACLHQLANDKRNYIVIGRFVFLLSFYNAIKHVEHSAHVADWMEHLDALQIWSVVENIRNYFKIFVFSRNGFLVWFEII